MSDYYEPWRPRVGQRVRVRLSGECPSEEQHDAGPYGVDGAHGVVLRAYPTGSNGYPIPNGHDYCVGFGREEHGYFAAIELEPADE